MHTSRPDPISSGFAGIENALFYADNTRMLYADGKEAANQLIGELKMIEGGGGIEVTPRWAAGLFSCFVSQFQ